MTWGPPLDNGGSPILKYIIKHKPRRSPALGWSMATKLETTVPSLVLPQMDPDVELYEVRVRAKNKVGHGDDFEYVLNFGT